MESLLRRTLAGRMLVTSRLGQGWHALGAQILRLDVLGEAEAVELLTRIATAHQLISAPGTKTPQDMEGALELVRELGHLPLAIEQAAAYLNQNQLTPHAYLNLLRKQPAAMYDQAARGSRAERMIARLWRLTLDRLADIPAADDLLRILAWYGAEPIPCSVLDDLGAETPDVHISLGSLAAYNMITLDGGAMTVHRLVQAVARTPDPDDPHRQAADIDTARDRATTLLGAALPDQPRHPNGWPTWRALLPHITALTDHALPSTDTEDTAALLNETGVLLYDQGATLGAIEYFKRANTFYQQKLGADDPSTLALRNNLAAAYESAGDRSDRPGQP